MKLLLISLCFLLFNSSILKGQKNLSEAEKDLLDLVEFHKKYSTIISYEKETSVTYPAKTYLVKKGKRWTLIYWVRKKITKDEILCPECISPRYKKKKQLISTIKGDSILALFIDKQFSSLDTE